MRSLQVTESGMKVITGVLAASLAGALLAMPRPISPQEMPTLRLRPEGVARAATLDAKHAAQAPSGKAVTRLQQLCAEHGRAEAERRRSDSGRLRSLRATLRRVRERHGEQAVRALRAAAALRAVDALRGRMPASERRATLGRFEESLERYELVRDGERIAPMIAVRALYKARWNALTGLELTAGLHPAEQRAYWGWLALHASQAPQQRRREALSRYEELGGPAVAEAKGTLAFAQGEPETAARQLGEALGDRFHLRLRNHHLATLRSSQ